MIPREIPTSGLADFVRKLALEHGVHYAHSGLDDLADTITRLAGDDVTTDKTEDLIVELKRAGIINAGEMVDLLGRHVDERGRSSLLRPSPNC